MKFVLAARTHISKLKRAARPVVLLTLDDSLALMVIGCAHFVQEDIQGTYILPTVSLLSVNSPVKG